ncbi:MAG: hypothetical protein ABWZ26_01320 [Candidatus Nanopelagicales bacterium]
MRARPVVAVAAAAMATTLTACEKPVPSVSFWSGTTTHRVSAACWSFEADEPLVGDDAQDCLAGATENAQELEVHVGQRIGISVDPVVAENGWLPTIGESRLTAEPVEVTYFGFAISEQDLSDGPLELRVIALSEDGQGRGIWAVRLTHV